MPDFLLDRDPATGEVDTFRYDDAEDRAIVKTSVDVEPVIDRNKQLYTAGDGYTPDRTMRRAASIPMSVVLEWRQKFGVDVFKKEHWPAVRRLLNSNEYLYLRTAPGRL
jgi:hypothetical protein